MNIKMDTYAGDSFDVVAKKAKNIAVDSSRSVEFEFNGVICIVNDSTSLEWLYRDYANSWIMGWKAVGPYCTENYSPEVSAEFKRLTADRVAKQDAEQKILDQKDADQKRIVSKMIDGIPIQLKDAEKWQVYVDKNKDSYGACCIEYAETWARLMQKEMASGKPLIEIAGPTSFQLGYLGITGFMYGCAVSMLSACWIHGEELRKWHNKEWNHEGDGVVNPAIMTLK